MSRALPATPRSRPLGWVAGGILILVAVFAVLLLTAGPGTLDVLDRIMTRDSYRHVVGVPYGTHRQTLDIWEPNAASPHPRPVLVFFYGGGWVKGSARDYGWAARGFASQGFVVVVPDYRKVPDVVFPAFVEDGAEAVRWTHETIAHFGGDPARLAVAGHSAGAHTAVLLALDPRWLAAERLPRETIKAAVGLSGPYDFYPFTGRAIAAMGQWPRPQETQPIQYARTDAPPMLLVTGTADTTVRPRNARNLAARLKAAGASVEEREYAGLGHEDIAMALSLPFRGKAPVLFDSARFIVRALSHLDRSSDTP